MTEISPVSVLHQDQAAALIGAVNSELKIILLSSLGEGAMSATDLHFKVHEDMAGATTAAWRAPFTTRQHLQRLEARNFVEPVGVDIFDETVYQVAPLGEIALGLGGFLLPAGVEHNVPLLPVVGNAILDERRNTIATRLAILMQLQAADLFEWVPVPDINRFVKEAALKSKNSTRVTINKMHKDKVIEKTSARKSNGSTYNLIRLNESSDRAYRAFIASYFKGVAAISTLDEPTLQNSREALSLFMTDARKRGLIGGLIKRSQDVSSHFGMQNQKS